MAGSANILRRLSEPNRTPRLLHDALVNPTRARSSATGSKDERLQQTAAKPQGGCTRGPRLVREPCWKAPYQYPDARQIGGCPCQACGVQGPLPRSFPCPIVGRATMSDSRRAGTTRTRWFDRSLSGTPHAWESPKALRAVIHGYAPRKKEPLPSWQGNSHSWGGGRR